MAARRVFLGLIVAAAMLVPLPAAALDAIGDINVDTIWRLSDSPVNLTGDVTVADHASLTIEPGVQVVASATDLLGAGTDVGKVELIILGALHADGTATQRIAIRGATASSGSWYGISIAPGARASSMTYVDVSHAVTGLWSRTTEALTLSDLTVTRCGAGILWHATPGPTIERATIADIAGIGLRLEDDGTSGAMATLLSSEVRSCTGAGVSLGPRVSASISRSILDMNEIGVLAESSSALAFRNNVVVANRTGGLDLTQSGSRVFAVVNTTLDLNVPRPAARGTTGTGIYVHAVSMPTAFIIRNNIVTNHGAAGIRVDGSTIPSVDHNNVWHNGTDYVGLTAGVGSISANPLYVEPAAGGGGGAWISVPWSIVVSYPPNSYSNSWTASQPGAIAMRAHIATLSTEACCDHLYVYDGAGTNVATYSGTFSGPTATALGSTLRLTFTTDSSVISTGFTVDAYEYQTGGRNYRVSSSSPVIDAGNDLDAPTDDRDGTARPYDGDVDGTPVTDMGAYEWHENIPPTAVAGPDRTILPSTVVDFDAFASYDPDGVIASYEWNFGDGTPVSTESAVAHTFTTLGTYTVTLTVRDDMDATGTDTAVITVADNLPPVADAGPDQFVDSGVVVTLNGGGSSDPDGTIVGYAWDFGDGSPAGSGRSVTHVFSTTGVYTVTLTVTDNRAATATDTASIVVGTPGGNQPPRAEASGPYRAAWGEAIEFDGSGSTDGDGTIFSYEWDFGDGSTGVGETVSHTYVDAGGYIVTLVVTDDDGATDSDVTTATVSRPDNVSPTADAGGPYSANLGDTVVFDGSGSSDADGTITLYEWDLGDGGTMTGMGGSHVYAAAGTYVVILTVTDNGGATSVDVTSVTITSPGNDPPVADAGGGVSGAVGENIAFDGSDSTDSDGTIVSYAWDFGDGTTGSGEMTTHAFTAAGSFLVQLTVTDDDGAIDQDTVLANIGGTPSNLSPVAEAGTAQTVRLGEAAILDGSGSSDSDGIIAAYSWDFGDGSTGAGMIASHTFATAGPFIVTLTVTDDDGATASDMVVVTVTTSVVPGGDDGSGCGCTVVGGDRPSRAWSALLLGAALLLVIVRRRRR
jgi:MYXO-CTERM domain-containing protein